MEKKNIYGSSPRKQIISKTLAEYYLLLSGNVDFLNAISFKKQ